MSTSLSSSSLSRALRSIAIGLLVLTACRADDIVALSAGERNQRVHVGVGDRVEITLQSIGPGEYSAPPEFSSAAVVFIDVAYVDFVPAGVTQRFRFRAVERGQAVLTFTHSGNNPSVQDTVVVE